MTDAPEKTKALQDALGRHLQSEVSLSITNNRRRMLTFRNDGSQMRVRVHRMFLMASESTVSDLASLIKHRDGEASKRIGEFVREHMHLVQPDPPRNKTVTLNTEGEVFDLQKIFDDLNEQFFGGACSARIGWGRGNKHTPKASVRLGSYVMLDRIIRIHPVLDNPKVPDFVIGWVVYHEMLHDLIGADGGPGRYHTKRFREAEAAYPDSMRAAEWEHVNLNFLLGRRKKPMTPSEDCPAGPLFAPWRMPQAFARR